MFTVYILTNTRNNMQYVGITRGTAESRFATHKAFAKRKQDSLLYKHMLQYGAEAFSVQTLLTNIDTYEQACNLEHQFIEKYDTYHNGYNRNEGSSGVVHHTSQTKQKISSSLKGHVFPQSRNEKIRQAMLGREYKDEWRANLSKACKGKRSGEQNSFYGKTHSAETIEHLRKAHAKRPVIMCDPNFNCIKEFISCSKASRWLKANGLCNKPSTASGRIRFLCDSNKIASTAYTFHWKYKEGPSTNCKAGDELPSEAQSSCSKG